LCCCGELQILHKIEETVGEEDVPSKATARRIPAATTSKRSTDTFIETSLAQIEGQWTPPLARTLRPGCRLPHIMYWLRVSLNLETPVHNGKSSSKDETSAGEDSGLFPQIKGSIPGKLKVSRVNPSFSLETNVMISFSGQTMLTIAGEKRRTTNGKIRW
jgi:hypothetical protein